jgi:acetyltransferase (GNAT) family protein
MKIRFATLQDVPTLLDIGEMMVAESRFDRYGLNRAKTGKALASMIQRPADSLILVAERDNGDAVGMLGGYVVELFFSDTFVAQDRFYFVKPEARGSSAALKLLLAFRRWAEQRKVRELNINMSVAVEMPRFNKMMTKLGFRCCGSNFSLGLGTETAASPPPPKASGKPANGNSISIHIENS